MQFRKGPPCFPPAASSTFHLLWWVLLIYLFFVLVQKDKNCKIKSKDNVTQHFKNNQRRETFKKGTKKKKMCINARTRAKESTLELNMKICHPSPSNKHGHVYLPCSYMLKFGLESCRGSIHLPSLQLAIHSAVTRDRQFHILHVL